MVNGHCCIDKPEMNSLGYMSVFTTDLFGAIDYSVSKWEDFEIFGKS